jgi:hypothetical protein
MEYVNIRVNKEHFYLRSEEIKNLDILRVLHINCEQKDLTVSISFDTEHLEMLSIRNCENTIINSFGRFNGIVEKIEN